MPSCINYHVFLSTTFCCFLLFVLFTSSLHSAGQNKNATEFFHSSRTTCDIRKLSLLCNSYYCKCGRLNGSLVNITCRNYSIFELFSNGNFSLLFKACRKTLYLDISDAVLQCDCKNFWTSKYSTSLTKTAVIEDSDWPENVSCHQCASVTPAYLMNLPRQIHLPKDEHCIAPNSPAKTRVLFSKFIRKNCQSSAEILKIQNYFTTRKNIHVQISIASGPELELTWFYSAKQLGQLWIIVPSQIFGQFSTDTMPSGFYQGWMVQQVIAKFPDTDLNCNGGEYYLRACNDYGCDFKTFFVHTTYPIGCAEANKTFLVSKIISMSSENENQSTNTAVISTAEPSTARNSDANWVFLTLFLGTLLTLMVMFSICLAIRFAGHVLCCTTIDKRRQQAVRANLHSETISLNDFRSSLAIHTMHENNAYISWLEELRKKSAFPFIPSTELKVVKPLGEGAFGCVHLVRWINAASFQAKEQFKICVISSTFFTKFLDNVKDQEGFALLFEYMEEGDLVHYLRNHNPDLMGRNDDGSEPLRPLKYEDLLQISTQVASGLEYLASRHLVHRDLAARNCLVGPQLVVKISDFGMTRDLDITDYYKMGESTLVPLRWLPPESVVFRRFTTESDVWSLGVLLWEVFSYGQVPWYAYSNAEVMEFVKEGKVLERPNVCPEQIYNSLILACCKILPADRLTAQEAKQRLERLLEEARCYCSVTPNNFSSEISTNEESVESGPQQKTE